MDFFNGVLTRKPVIEDAVFGFRTAAPCPDSNDGYFEKKIQYRNPEGIDLVKGAWQSGK